jgi:pimeloyl-ACP methyl ester carboxylesterase
MRSRRNDAGRRRLAIVGIAFCLAGTAAAQDEQTFDAMDVLAPQFARPAPPTSEDVTFESAEPGITLAGTLTIPSGDGPHPAVLIVSGLGPQNRDGLVFEQPVLKNISIMLARAGMVTLRFDDRGVGASTGDHQNATTTDFTEDAEGGLRFLAQHPAVMPTRIAVVGHSEGGLVASRLAAKDIGVAAMVLLATPAEPGHEMIADQQARGYRANGMPEEKVDEIIALQFALVEAVRANESREAIESAASDLMVAQYVAQFGRPPSADTMRKSLPQAVAQATSPWIREFSAYDPVPDLTSAKVPALAVYGGADLQVSDEMNTVPMTQALRAFGHPQSRVVVFPTKNHLFQNATIGLISDYRRSGQAPTDDVLDTIVEWLESGLIEPGKRRR